MHVIDVGYGSTGGKILLYEIIERVFITEFKVELKDLKPGSCNKVKDKIIPVLASSDGGLHGRAVLEVGLQFGVIVLYENGRHPPAI
jgi:hypothetical protein